MKVIRYQITPEQVAENKRLITDVFREMEAKRPANTRYLVLALPDGTFIHVADGDIATLESHRAFRTGINDRCTVTPTTVEATIVGEYVS